MSPPEPLKDERRLLDPSAEDRRSFGAAFERLVGLMARLRGPAGCPWDREQSLDSLRPYLIEEAYEVLDALDAGSPDAHKEELGDLLLQVVFHAEIRRQEGRFDSADVAHAIADKLVRRHPHVFGPEEARDPAQAFQRWEATKAKEKGGRKIAGSVPRQLPALLRAQRITEKAANVGFDWPSVSGPVEKLSEELGELEEAIAAGDRGAMEAELGDLLFTVVNVARFLGVVSEEALRKATDKFERRFGLVEDAALAQDRSIQSFSPEELDGLWEEAKAGEAK